MKNTTICPSPTPTPQQPLAIFCSSSVYSFLIQLFIFQFSFVFLGLHSRHMEVPRLGVQLELWPLSYTTATAMPDLSHICDLHHSSWQRQSLNLIEARDRTRNLMVPSWIHFLCTMTGTLIFPVFNITCWHYYRKLRFSSCTPPPPTTT